MKKYTAAYSGVKDNFVIINNDENYKQDTPYYGLLCVIQNIIQRGKPSIPSKLLQESLGQIDNPITRALYLASNDIPEWNVIKGDDFEIDYPAEDFYYNLLPKYLGEYAIVRNLIIPEADFQDVLGKSTALDGQQVDFFFPQLRTVIEIDGYSHKQLSQVTKDGIRDAALRKAGIVVLRISTEDIRKESDHFIAQMYKLKSAVKEANIVQNLFAENTCSEYALEIRYDAVIRLEILLLELLKAGRLNINDNNWEINFASSDVENIENLLDVAYADLKNWFSVITQMLKMEVTFPALAIKRSKKSIKIDFSIFKRYTDKEKNIHDCVFVRNDYFTGSNYYHVAYSDTLKYKFTPETEDQDNASLKYVLNNLFPDIDDFRDGQLQIIKNVLMQNDTIGILPTGTGKSLCYQLASMLQPGVTMVIVPIISLMIDQQESMNKRFFNHISAVSSSLNGEEKEKVISEFGNGKYQFLWMSPERFQSASFRDTLVEINRKMNFSFAVIDEVHCLSEWGHDFRVSYLALIKILREFCPEATLLGLTATASQAVLEDLKAEFEVDGSAIKAVTNMDRPELIFHRKIIDSESEKAQEIYSIIKENNKAYTNLDGTSHDAIGLVFCPTVSGTKTCCEAVEDAIKYYSGFDRETKLRLAQYHANLSNKNEIQNRFSRNEYNVLVCTKAFGMGIDQPNIKYTIHDTMPQSIEEFYQEAGRAGRDKDKSVESHCYVLFCPEQGSIRNEKVKEIFDPNTDIEKRKILSKDLNGDLSTIMWFWNNNKVARDEEYSRIYNILTKLYKGERRLQFISEDNLTETQEALYKLSILGVVADWTLEYKSFVEGTVDVEYTGLEKKDIRSHLLAYINKYDPEFQIDEPSKEYQKYYDLAHAKDTKIITQYIYILIDWTNENIMNSRLQSTYNMMEWLDPRISDEDFRQRINAFFKFSDESVIYNWIIYHPLEFENWFDLLFIKNKAALTEESTLLTIESAKLRLAGLQRYLESYRYNTGLNYLSGILRLYTASYSGTEGEWRLDEAFRSIKENLNASQQDIVITKTLNIAKYFELAEKDLLSEAIIKYFPEFKEKIFKEIEDRYSMSLILTEATNRLNKIVEEM